MCVSTTTTIANNTVGRVPRELLEDGVERACASEWTSRMICWTLQALTHIPAAEHMLCGSPAGFCVDGVVAGVRSSILVYKRSDPGRAVFAIEVGGDDSGCVVSI